MDFKFNLGVKTKLPENGFSLSELVIATKQMFETEGMTGFLRVLLEILDQCAYLSMTGSSEHSCCNKPYFRVNKHDSPRSENIHDLTTSALPVELILKAQSNFDK